MTQGEIQSNSSLFIVAGSDSTATVLTGTTYYLLQSPELLQKATDEVRTSFNSEEEINAQSVGRLPYVIACLDEASRIYPTILTGQAVIVPREGDVVGNEWIPGGVCCRYQSLILGLHQADDLLPSDWTLNQHVRCLSILPQLS